MTTAQSSGHCCASPSRRVELPRRVPGFTLLEMLIVLTLIGLLVAVTIPILGNGVSTTELKSDTRAVAAGYDGPVGMACGTPAQEFMGDLGLDLIFHHTGLNELHHAAKSSFRNTNGTLRNFNFLCRLYGP